VTEPSLGLFQYVLRRWPSLVAIVVLASMTAALEALSPWPLKLILDHVLRAKPLDSGLTGLGHRFGQLGPLPLLRWLTGGMVLVFVATWICRAAQAYLVAKAGAELSYGLAAQLFDRLQRLSLSFHRSHAKGDLVKRIVQDTDAVRQLLAGVIVPLSVSLLSLSVMLFVMSRLDPLLALAAAVVVPFLGVSIWYFAKPMTEHTYRQYALQGDVMALAEQTLTSLPVVKAFFPRRLRRRAIQPALAQSRCCLPWGHCFSAPLQSCCRIGDRFGHCGAVGIRRPTCAGGQAFRRWFGRIPCLPQLFLCAFRIFGLLSAGWAAVQAGARRVFEVFDSSERVPQAPDHPDRRRRGHHFRERYRLARSAVQRTWRPPAVRQLAACAGRAWASTERTIVPSDRISSITASRGPAPPSATMTCSPTCGPRSSSSQSTRPE